MFADPPVNIILKIKASVFPSLSQGGSFRKSYEICHQGRVCSIKKEIRFSVSTFKRYFAHKNSAANFIDNITAENSSICHDKCFIQGVLVNGWRDGKFVIFAIAP